MMLWENIKFPTRALHKGSGKSEKCYFLKPDSITSQGVYSMLVSIRRVRNKGLEHCMDMWTHVWNRRETCQTLKSFFQSDIKEKSTQKQVSRNGNGNKQTQPWRAKENNAHITHTLLNKNEELLYEKGDLDLGGKNQMICSFPVTPIPSASLPPNVPAPLSVDLPASGALALGLNAG